VTGEEKQRRKYGVRLWAVVGGVGILVGLVAASVRLYDRFKPKGPAVVASSDVTVSASSQLPSQVGCLGRCNYSA
jgi:hypothetical protein